jgi:hypothetical protein
MQLCRSHMNISQDACMGNGQRKETFWDRVGVHYNRHKPIGCGARSARSLDSKWVSIKHDVSKFVSAYGHVFNNAESGKSDEDILQDALELYKVRHAKGHPFVYLHCWLLLQDYPRWMETPQERQNRTIPPSIVEEEPPRRAMTPTAGDDDVDDIAGEAGDFGVQDPAPAAPVRQRQCSATPAKRGRPLGGKATKDEQQKRHQRDQGVKKQEKVTADIAAANYKKAQVLEDQAALSLFIMPDDRPLSNEAAEYLQLRKEEELLKLRERVLERKANLAKAAAARVRQEVVAAEEATRRAAEIAEVQGRRQPAARSKEVRTTPRRISPTRSPLPAATAQAAPPVEEGAGANVNDDDDDPIEDSQAPDSFGCQSPRHPPTFSPSPRCHPCTFNVQPAPFFNFADSATRVVDTPPDLLNTPPTSSFMATIANRQGAPPPRPDLNSTGPHRMAGMILTPSIA